MVCYSFKKQSMQKLFLYCIFSAALLVGFRSYGSDDVKKTIISALKVNEDLHQSFFKYDKKMVEINALKLKKAIDAINDKKIAKLLNFSKTKLLDIKAKNDRELNNQNYHLVSMALIHIVSKYEIGSDYNAYYCPMLKKKWIQNKEKVATVNNPYAPEMPHCGRQD